MRLYRRLDAYFAERPAQDQAVRSAGRLLTGLFYAAFLCLCIRLFRTDRERLKRVVTVTASCYLSGTVIRAAVDAPRPADVIPDLQRQDGKRGRKSFPSRHSFSAAVIAMAFAWMDRRAGLTAAFLAAAMAAERVLEGDHWIRDVVAGLLYGGLFGAAGFFGKDWIKKWQRLD